MARRNKREKRTYRLECTITGETFKRTATAPNPDELVSISAYYELNPEKDDRPAVVKKRLGVQEADKAVTQEIRAKKEEAKAKL